MPTRKKSGIKFEDPPPKREQRYDWAKIAAKLRDRPGEWALVFEHDLTSLVTAFSLGGLKDLPPDEFEAQTSNNDRGRPASGDDPGIPRTCTLHMRYVGPNKEHA